MFPASYTNKCFCVPNELTGEVLSFGPFVDAHQQNEYQQPPMIEGRPIDGVRMFLRRRAAVGPVLPVNLEAFNDNESPNILFDLNNMDL